MEGAIGPEPETPVEYTRRIRAMVHEAASNASTMFSSVRDTALDLYTVALDELFGIRWRDFAHPENGDILRHYIDDPVRWESRVADR